MKSSPNRATRISIIGKSRAGGSIASALRANKNGAFVLHSQISAHALLGLRSERDAAAARQVLRRNGGPDVLIIATNDDSIDATAREALRVAGNTVVRIIQLAGSRPSTLLPAVEGVARLTLHPIQTFPRINASQLTGITWTVASDEPSAIVWGKRFVKALGAKRPIVLTNEQLPLYHAMLSLSANGIAILLGAAEAIMRGLGLNEREMKLAIQPLMERSLANALARPAGDALTGPIARGDSKTIASHKHAIAALDQPAIAALYDALERSTRELTVANGTSAKHNKLLRKR